MRAPGDRLSDSVPGELRPADRVASVELLAAARLGDEDAARDLLVRHHERLSRIVRIRLGRRLRRDVETQDVVQETYRAALQGLAGLDLGGEPDLLAWLVRVAVNRIRDEADRQRAQRRDAGREEVVRDDSTSSPTPADPAPSPASQAARRELHELLDAAVAELADDQRDVVLMRDYGGAAWERIAADLGRASVHAAQQLHQRAWIRLRQALEPRLRDPRA